MFCSEHKFTVNRLPDKFNIDNLKTRTFHIICTGTPSYCIIYSINCLPWVYITIMVLFLATFCIGIGVLVVYARFPTKFCNGDEPEEPEDCTACIYTGPSCGYNCCREDPEQPEDSFPKVHSDYYNEHSLGSSNEERVRF